jgi:hypothetical protein
MRMRRVEAWSSWNDEFGYFLDTMEYSYYYEISQADYDPAEDNYEIFCNAESTRYPDKLF